ncbi:metallophosphoesterase, partial [Nocardioides massiliensis]
MRAAGELLRTALGVLALLLLLATIVAWARWLHRRLTVHAGAPRWVRIVSLVVVAGGLVLFGVANVAYRFLDPEPWRPVIVVGLTWLAVAWYLTLGCALVAVPARVLRLSGRLAARRRWLRVSTVAVVVATVAVTAYGAVVAARPGVVAYDVEIAGLPAGWDGTRVVLVTDLHVGAVHGQGWTRRMADLVAAQDPELVVLAGDLVDGWEVHTGPLLAPIADLDAPLGAFAVSGNHEVESGDGAAYLDRFEEVGLTVLRNDAVRIERGGDKLVVAGVHDATGTGALAPDADAALAG